MRRAAALLVAAALAASAQAPAAAQEVDGVRFRVGDGVRVTAGALRARVRTRFHIDRVSESLGDVYGPGVEPGAAPFEEGIGLRRARWLADARFADGSALAWLSGRTQVDFGSSRIRWLDLYGDARLGTAFAPDIDTRLRFGQFRETFGLEAMTSVTYLPFIERSAATNAFTPGRNRGVQWSARGPRFGLAAGLFAASEGRPFPDELGTERAATLHGFVEFDGTLVDQFGVGLSLRDPGDDGARFRARPGTRLLERVVDTGALEADGATVVSLEALRVRGGTMLLAEAFGASTRGATEARFHGGHVALSHFLHAGSVDHGDDDGGLGAPNVPDAWSTRENGNGAVELALRAGWVDLEDGPVDGGRVVDVEAGFNWYLQPGTRFMLHGLFVRGAGGATGEAILARLQLQL
ncbi:MAG: porin [Planctomycetota bacterium]